MPREVQIDERTVVPLSWVVNGVIALVSAAILGTITVSTFVSSVNFRLKRIEEKMGIPPLQSAADIVIESANANSNRE